MMITLKLTEAEWYFLTRQLQKIIEEHKYNHVPKRILKNLMDNMPCTEGTIDFKTEYDCKWEATDKGTALVGHGGAELDFDLSRMIKKD